ncbi:MULTISPECIES: hypothetical protein [unclassified Microbacterium]|uniref:hypothetical protein n=1 Tax=unclassified Microbacterium TaxID=2609290 RepID=UPI00301AB77F
MVSNLDLFKLADPLPEGLPPGAERGAIITGRLLGLDITAGLAQVSVNESDGVWVPAAAAIYPPNGYVRLLRSPLDGGRIAYCLGPLVPGSTIAGGRVVSVNSTVGLLKVTTLGATYDLPYPPGTYAANTPVHVVRSPSRFGLPEYVLGPSGSYNAANPGQPGGGAENPAQVVSRQAIILPQFTGAWRANFGRWNEWNTDRYGGRTTLYQGNAFGSGPMVGLAGYGEQIVALGALKITRMQAAVYRADSSTTAAKVPVLQPSPHGGHPGGAPTISPSAAATGPALVPNAGAHVDLPASVFEAFRTGAFKGLVTVGSDYAGFSGAPDRAPIHADGMALVVQYQVAG